MAGIFFTDGKMFLCGYSQYKHNGKYGARIGIDDKIIHLGLFDTPEKAHQAYLNAKSIYHTENKN